MRLVFGLLFAVLVDKGIVVSLDFENAAIPFAFLFCYGVHFIPGFKKLSVLFRQTNSVCLFHVETDSGDDATRFFARLSLFLLEVYDCLAFAVHRRRVVGPLAVHKVVAVSVDFSDGWIEIVKIAFHNLEGGVVGAAVLASSFLPAGEKVTHVVGCYDMFPLDGLGSLKTFPVRIFAWFEIAGTEVHCFLIQVFAPAVQSFLKFSVIDSAHLLSGVSVIVMLWLGFGVYLGLGKNGQA